MMMQGGTGTCRVRSSYRVQSSSELLGVDDDAWVVMPYRWGGCAKERAGFKVDGGILINRAWPSQLPDVATYRPNDTGG